MSRPRAVLSVGDRVLVDGVSHVLVGLSGTTVRLASTDGTVVTATVAELLSAENVQIPSSGPARTMPVVGVDGLPEEVLEAASWWERHIVEVLYGGPVQLLSFAVCRPGRGWVSGLTAVACVEDEGVVDALLGGAGAGAEGAG